MQNFKITVLLPIYQESNEYVKLAINSILHQTFTRFKLFVCLDDPNNERLKKLMSNYLGKDDRINFFVNEKNLGLPNTLNFMLKKVNTPYIARMDADDISDSYRLEKQYNFMLQHPDIDLCGTNIVYIDKNGKEIHRKGRLPAEQKEIVKTLSYIDVFCHPTFFAKTEVLQKELYRNLKYAQDYDLVCRLTEKGYKLTNLNEYLLYYRTGEVGEKKLFEQRIIAGQIQKFYKKGCLNKTNIQNDVSKILSFSSDKIIKKYKLSCDIYENGIIKLKHGNKFHGICLVLKSFFISRYQRENIWKALVYRGVLARL